MRDRGSLATLLVALVVFVSLSAALPGVWSATAQISDVPVYERYGDAIERGRVPYRDFRLEYPPGALAAFALPSIVTNGRRSYARAFALEMLLLGLTAICACFVAFTSLGLGRLRLAAALAVPASAPLLLGPLVLTRFDLYPAALTAIALAAVLAGRDRLGAGALGAAVAVKLYPVVLVPLAVALAWRRHGRHRAMIVLGVCALAALVVFLPFLALSPGGVAWSVRRQLDRPLQIESLGAAVLLALHHVAAMPLGWASSHGSQNLTGTVATVAAAVTTVLQLAALGYVWWRFAARSTPSLAAFGESCFAALLVFVALGKVLSPQFLVWLLPAVGLLTGRRFWPGMALIVGTCALTRGWFPSRYWRLVFEFDGLASWLVFARDLLLVALLVLLLGSLTRFAPARSP
jgi:uncharacterized membrane protein